MAFKMNREGFTFYTKPEGPTMKHTNQFGKPHPEKEEDDYINIRKMSQQQSREKDQLKWIKDIQEWKTKVILRQNLIILI